MPGDKKEQYGTHRSEIRIKMTTSEKPQQFLELVNEARIEADFVEVTLNEDLNEAAYNHSRDIAEQDLGIVHTGSDGSTPGERVTDTGYKFKVVVENVGGGYYTADEAFEDWMSSPGHRANILNPDVRHLGAGHVLLENDTGNKNYVEYWTLVLADGASIPEEPAKPAPKPNPLPDAPAPAPATPIVEPTPTQDLPTPTPPKVLDNPPAQPEPPVSPITPAPTTPEVHPHHPPTPTPPDDSPTPAPTPPQGEAPPSVSPTPIPETPGPTEPSLVPESPVEVPVEEVSEGVTIAGDGGDDKIVGSSGNDVLRGDFNRRDPGNDNGGNDTIYGLDGDDRIGGKGGDDKLFGDQGDDAIWGDDGDDLLYGGLGDDVLTGDNFSGGSGADRFVLAVGAGTDTITDFETGIDLIGLANGLIFDDLSLGQRNSVATISADGEVLAQLNNIVATELTREMFVVVQL